jgi:hypothetical protein
MENSIHNRPHSLLEVADRSDSMEAFGANLRDWQHEIERGGVHSRKKFATCISEKPRELRNCFDGGDIADAYLAAYAEWLADKAGISRPQWCRDSDRIADKPWFSTSLHGYLLVSSPASFRQRQLFTVPDNVFTPRPGRPQVPESQKCLNARIRQKKYRQRVNSLLRKARSMGLHHELS